jgi:YbbR domain-containing protein
MGSLRNVWLKFLSLCIAALLWLVVAGDRVVERALRVPIEFQNLPPGLEIVGEPMESVDVRVRASSGTLARLAPGELAAVVDLRHARPGRRLFPLAPTSVRAPYGVEVVQVAPATLPVSFEKSAVRVVEVRPSLEGEPAPGYEVVAVSSRPVAVEVIGPESALRRLTEAMTEPISVAGATAPVREVATIGVADPNVRLRAPQTAEVVVQIVKGSSVRTVDRVRVKVRNLDNGLRGRAVPATVSVTIRGTKKAVSEAAPETLDAYVDAGTLGPGAHDAQVQVQPLPGVTVESVTPRVVRLNIVKP